MVLFQCYRRILEIDPENIQGLHNLCVVHVERGKLLEAVACLQKAHELAPEEEYVLRHLQIVQNKVIKLKLNPNKVVESYELNREESRVVSNKIVDSSEKRTQTVVTGDSEEQRYSSRVVNTEPLFVQNVQHITSVNDNLPFNDLISDKNEQNTSRWRDRKLANNDDDPSSGMS